MLGEPWEFGGRILGTFPQRIRLSKDVAPDTETSALASGIITSRRASSKFRRELKNDISLQTLAQHDSK
jgi:hypothetical protein